MTEPHTLSPDDAAAVEWLAEKSLPYLAFTLLALAICIGMVVVLQVLVRPWLEQQASPVEKIVRTKRRAF